MIFSTRPLARRSATSILIPALIVGAFALVVGPTNGLPRPAGDDTAYTLQRVYTKGDVDRYKIKFSLNSDGTALNGVKKIVITMVLKEETKEIKPDGAAVLHDSFDEASADMDEKKMDVAPLLPVLTETRDKQSHTLETKSEGGNPLAGNTTAQYAQQLLAFYPAKPIKVGESWDLDYSDTKAEHPYKIKGKGTLVSTETINGLQTLKIKIVTDTTEVNDPQNQEKAAVVTHFEGTGNMEIKTGKIVAMTGKSVIKGGPFTDGDVDLKLKTANDKDDKDGKDDKGNKNDNKATPDKKAGQ